MYHAGTAMLNSDSDSICYLGVASLVAGIYLTFIRAGVSAFRVLRSSIKSDLRRIFNKPFTERESDFADYIYGQKFDFEKYRKRNSKKYPEYRKSTKIQNSIRS